LPGHEFGKRRPSSAWRLHSPLSTTPTKAKLSLMIIPSDVHIEFDHFTRGNAEEVRGSRGVLQQEEKYEFPP
jgi:hypothetical protein